MKTMIACLAVLLLAACATPIKPPNPASAKSESGMVIVGTLSLGPCEMSIAPSQTRIRVAVEKATRRLADGRLAVADADRIENKATGALSRLGDVCRHQSAGNTDAAEGARAYAARNIEAIEQILKGAKP